MQVREEYLHRPSLRPQVYPRWRQHSLTIPTIRVRIGVEAFLRQRRLRRLAIQPALVALRLPLLPLFIQLAVDVIRTIGNLDEAVADQEAQPLQARVPG